MRQALSKYTFTLRLYDTDAAGFMFYARYFYYLHDAYEEMLHNHQLEIHKILDGSYLFPISHAEADFKSPVKLNQSITIEIFAAAIEKDRFSLRFEFKNELGHIVATARTQHVCINKQLPGTVDLPREWINMLK